MGYHPERSLLEKKLREKKDLRERLFGQSSPPKPSVAGRPWNRPPPWRPTPPFAATSQFFKRTKRVCQPSADDEYSKSAKQPKTKPRLFTLGFDKSAWGADKALGMQLVKAAYLRAKRAAIPGLSTCHRFESMTEKDLKQAMYALYHKLSPEDVLEVPQTNSGRLN